MHDFVEWIPSHHRDLESSEDPLFESQLQFLPDDPCWDTSVRLCAATSAEVESASVAQDAATSLVIQVHDSPCQSSSDVDVEAPFPWSPDPQAVQQMFATSPRTIHSSPSPHSPSPRSSTTASQFAWPSLFVVAKPVAAFELRPRLPVAVRCDVTCIAMQARGFDPSVVNAQVTRTSSWCMMTHGRIRPPEDGGSFCVVWRGLFSSCMHCLGGLTRKGSAMMMGVWY